VEPLRERVEAIHAEGAAAVLQLVHLGRETLGAETFFAPVALSAVRSPRERTLRALREQIAAHLPRTFLHVLTERSRAVRLDCRVLPPHERRGAETTRLKRSTSLVQGGRKCGT
jgi:hypothetical protein